MITIKTLELINFRNIEMAQYEFDDKVNIFEGKNGLGKTNTLGALYWLLCDRVLVETGKGANNDETLIPSNIEINETNNPLTSVSITLSNGKKLTKTIQNIYTRTRGTNEYSFKGREINRFVNDAICKASDFENEIMNAFEFNWNIRETISVKAEAPLNVLASFIDPLYLTSISPKVLRALITRVVGDITDEDVIKSNPKFDKLASLLDIYSHDTSLARNGLMKIVKECKEKVLTLDGSIEAFSGTTFDEKTYQANVDRINALNMELYNSKGKSDNQIQLEQEKSQLLMDQASINSEYLDEVNKSKSNLNIQKEIELANQINDKKIKINELENQLRDAKSKYLMNKNKYDSNLSIIENHKSLITRLSRDLENALEFKADEERCPHCNGILNFERIDIQNETNTKKIESIKKDIVLNNEMIKNIENDNEKCVSENNDLKNFKTLLETNISNIKNELATLENDLDVERNKPKERIISILETELKKELDGIAFKIENKCNEIKAMSDSDFSNKTKRQEEISLEIQAINRQQEALITAKNNIENLNKYKQQKQDKQRIQVENESLLILLELFSNTKTRMLNEKVSNVFGVEFVMLREQVNGGLEEVCYPIVDGVPFNDINTSKKILIGIKIIEGLKAKMALKDLPIVFDRAESLDDDTLTSIETKSQLFNTRVTSGINKICLNRKGEIENYAN